MPASVDSRRGPASDNVQTYGSVVGFAQPATMTLGIRRPGVAWLASALPDAATTASASDANEARTSQLFQHGALRQVAGRQETIDQPDGPVPVVRPERMTAGDHRRAGVEHLVLEV